jgi:hypothetical protein
MRADVLSVFATIRASLILLVFAGEKREDYQWLL